MSSPCNDLVLQCLAEIAEVVTIASNPDYEICVLLWICDTKALYAWRY